MPLDGSMTNQANVEALAALLLEASDGRCPYPNALAERLASRGVLVPSALTDDVFGEDGLGGFWWPDGSAMPSGDVRQRLERMSSSVPAFASEAPSSLWTRPATVKLSDAALKRLSDILPIPVGEARQVVDLVVQELNVKQGHLAGVLKVIGEVNTLRNAHQYKDPDNYYEYGRCLAVANQVIGFLREKML